MDLCRSVESSAFPVLLESSATIRRAMEVIDASALSVALLTDVDGRLTGVVTDGDIRRALLRGENLDDHVSRIVNRNPLVARSHQSRASVMDMMLSRVIDQIPIVDNEGFLVGLHTLREMLGRKRKDMPALVLAGGMGTRLGSLTRETPKPMLTVAGRPILERLIDHVVGYGIHDITIAVSYKADHIMNYFGDGSRHGCIINYLQDPLGKPRGTGGPFIDLVQHRGLQDDPVIVLNGDLVTTADLDHLISEHRDTAAQITIAASTFVHRIPYGVLRIKADGLVEAVDEKPLIESYVNAGIYVLSSSVAKLETTPGQVTMTEIINKCLSNGGRIHAVPLEGDWLDVGQPQDLALARGLIQ